MRLVVTGGREFTDEAFAFSYLDGLHERLGVDVLIEGEARGLDTIARRWAESRRIPVEPYPISSLDWKKFRNAAGPLRNLKMIEVGKPDYGVAFEGGNGTANMKSLMKRHGIPFEEAVRSLP